LKWKRRVSRREIKFAAWAIAAIVIGAASFLVGGALKPAEPPHYVFETESAAYEDPTNVAATTKGGFTGFGEVDGSLPRTVIAGRVVEKSDTAVVLETPGGQRTSLRFGTLATLSRAEPATQSLLRPGVTVAVRLNPSGNTVEAVLVLAQP
jgi:hypothetical protein